MIRLNEVAKKLEDVLNGSDPQVIALGLTPPTGYYFKVATEGFHIDSIFDYNKGKNFIPVFISSMGGSFNPVPDLMQANYVIPIAIYFPVRFKNDLYLVNEYLARAFVGRQLNYGPNSGTALSNVSVAQFGEIVESDLLEQYGQWQETIYKMKKEVMEPMLQMNIQLYLTVSDSNFIYGNDATATLTIDYDQSDTDLPDGWTSADATDQLTFVQQSIQSHADPAVQQLLGTNESEGLPTGTAYGASFAVYVKNSKFYQYLLKKWFDGNSQELTLTLNFNLLGKTFTRTCFIQSVNLVVQKGELVTITFTFSKKAVIEDGGL